MIISQTPFRVSFAGGGTDLPAYYRQQYGAVLSVALDCHMYVTVHRRFEPTIRVAYSRTEMADRVDDVQHTLVRESLRKAGLERHLEITTIADIPAGTGLGSSSALTVGVLNALYAYSNRIVNRDLLAREAAEIEIDILGHPIGKQDQYAAAFGGMNYIRFNPDGSVDVEPVPMSTDTRGALESHVLLMYTEQRRDANAILKKQSEATGDQMEVLTEMRDLADAMRSTLTESADLEEFARLLHHGWSLKRSLGCGITDTMIDGWYEAARGAGALGGKLLGAGGGGFLMLLAPPEHHEAIREVLGRPRELPFDVDPRGTRIVFISDHD
jgi:D-glycero-alpha-D-manno-heptose-7-phosphate kinase